MAGSFVAAVLATRAERLKDMLESILNGMRRGI